MCAIPVAARREPCMAELLLEMRGIEKRFGGVHALRGVDFDLRPGEVHALLGENGAGKSTLIKVVTGAHEPDGGTVAIGGQAVTGLTPASARRLGVACIYQQPALFPDTEIRQLSMPEQQLVEIACAIGAGARIVVMDEPTASLTQKEQLLLFSVVRDLRTSGVGVIYITHRLEEIFALADRVTVLRDGESVGTHQVGDINEAGLIRM